MTPEQKAVVLDYVTEWQTDDEAWCKFEYQVLGDPAYNPTWIGCCKFYNPIRFPQNMFVYEFRRKPRTITVTMPVHIDYWFEVGNRVVFEYENAVDANKALAAIREAMGDG